MIEKEEQIPERGAGTAAPVRLNETDRQILDMLQDDARISRAAIGEAIGLSPAAVHERVRKLERRGVVQGYAALLDPVRAGCDLLVFVLVFIDHPKHEARFVEAVGRMEEVQECHHVTGSASCLLKVRVRDRHALQTVILDRINALDGVRQTETIVVLSTTKETPRLHLEASGD